MLPQGFPSPRFRGLSLLALLVVAMASAGLGHVACTNSARAAKVGGGNGKADSALRIGGERRLVLFYTAEVHGAVEPCGCTSDPLGDVSRLSALIADTKRKGTAVALVDAGGILYPEGSMSAKEQASADVRAEFLAAEFERMGLLAATIGEGDLARGATHVRPARLASNVSVAADGAGGKVLRAARVERIGNIAVGVVGVVDPQLADAVAAAVRGKAEDPIAAAKRDVARLRAEGAELVVLLASVEKVMARKLAKEVAPDVIVLGRRVGRGLSRLEQVGRTFVVAPQDELQHVGRMEIVLRNDDARTADAGQVGVQLIDAGGPEANRLRREEIKKAEARLEAGLVQWTREASVKSPGDAVAAKAGDFVAQKRRELAELAAERKGLEVPWQPPTTGSYVVNELVPMRRRLRQDLVTVAAMKKLDQRIAAINLKNAARPPKAEPGRAHYVGTQACASCHSGAQKFWDKTVHAHAWKTLVDGGKQADYKCISCHVTGFGQVGGSSLGFTKKLESVQCETCHGPGSLHVAGEGNEEPLAIRRDTPETACLGCHTETHSDTFQFEAYMRDVVGPGHGGQRRVALGNGPTGHELRSAALKRAKLAAFASPH